MLFRSGVQLGKSSLFGSYSYQESDGWIPVRAPQRGAADSPVTLMARSISARFETVPFTGTVLAVRGGLYDEHRNAGIVGSQSRTQGASGSITLAHPESQGELGWRLQTWFRNTDLANVTYAVQGGLARSSTLPSNNQYATPAIGYGFNAALRGQNFNIDWEAGADARFNQGETRELYQVVSGAYTRSRLAGGRNYTGGIYAEGASRFDGWLITAGARLDNWSSSNGHLTQRTISTGALLNDTDYAPKSGVLPTGRLGIRKDWEGGFYSRMAGYEGFRVPSLNELYRPFRLGNNFTLANPALTPEKLYGAEVGGGFEMDGFSLDAALFWNRLDDAITNVTTGVGPQTIDLGFVPAGGLIIQRQNAGVIDAFGVEGDASWRASDTLSFNAAFALTSASVNGGTAAPQLTGKRPAQTPRWTITAGAVTTPVRWLTQIGRAHV